MTASTATLSNVLSFPQSAPPATTPPPPPSLVLSGSITNPDANGNIPYDGSGIVALSLTDPVSPAGTVDTLAVTLNNETQGTAVGLPSASFPALVSGSASLNYTVPAVPAGTLPTDVLSVSFQASTPA
jgi:hypothetical protein